MVATAEGEQEDLCAASGQKAQCRTRNGDIADAPRTFIPSGSAEIDTRFLRRTIASSLEDRNQDILRTSSKNLGESRS